MSPVELLREAARVMRREAEGLTALIDDATDDTDRVPVEMGDALRRYLSQLPAVADWLDREARRIGSHAIIARKVREDWYAYQCLTCGVGGSTSAAGLAAWQEAHARVRLVADDAALALARAYLGGEQS